MLEAMRELHIACGASGDREAIEHLKRAIAEGKHWYIALLEAIGLWTSPEETYNGRTYRYLIANEAFNWLLLAERLIYEVADLITEEERDNLLFFGKPPLELAEKEFKGLIGRSKYCAYLNYFYGVIVEGALVMAVEEEVRKEHRSLGYSGEQNIVDEVYERLYGADQATLLRKFRMERGYPLRRSISLSELEEFTYWLFKHRLRRCDKARVASDTKKGLEELKRRRGASQLWREPSPCESQDAIEP